jgi:GNAT superfamily N-acetyltransferase
MEITFRAAVAADAPAVADLVASAYRGEASRAGWTTEADLIDGQRIDAAEALGKITAPGSMVLVVSDDAGVMVSCCELARRDSGLAYFGLFAVRPDLQAVGLGRRVLAEAERIASRDWGCARLEMQVIVQRNELIAWYERRGYLLTGATRPFPYGQRRHEQPRCDDMYFVVLAKDLKAQHTE